MEIFMVLGGFGWLKTKPNKAKRQPSAGNPKFENRNPKHTE